MIPKFWSELLKLLHHLDNLYGAVTVFTVWTLNCPLTLLLCSDRSPGPHSNVPDQESADRPKNPGENTLHQSCASGLMDYSRLCTCNLGSSSAIPILN